MSVLKVSGLVKSYKKGFLQKQHLVLKSVDFSVESGVITGFLGGNGAGKTTTLKCLLGLAFPQEGEIQYFGNNELSLQEAKRRIGFLPERPYFYEYLTGFEFLQFYGSLSGKWSKNDLKQRIHKLLDRVGLDEAKNRKLKNYSKGMLQKVGVAQALIDDPEFIILDEPMSGLDPDGRYALSEIIKETAKEGKTVFFSSHLLHDVEQLCERLVILKSGKVEFEGLTTDLIDQIGSGYKIQYRKSDGAPMEEALCSNQQEVQTKIDELRKQGYVIFEVKNQKATLEEAFVKVGLEK